MSNSPMQTLFSRIKPLGVNLSFARRALPSWWDDTIASSEAGLQQAQLYIAKAFNLDIRSFDGPQIKFRQAQRKFKLSSNVTEDAVNVSAHYVTGIARTVLHAVDQQRAVPVKALELRRECLAVGKGVDLDTLLLWCARANIPVMHVDELPGKKMTGLVVRDNDKFAIVLSRKGCQSEMLFWLAHELGHIACGHLNKDGFFADESIGTNVQDVEEKQADAYGVFLLNGADTKYTVKAALRASDLAAAATRYGQTVAVDAGHILLNFGHHNPKFHGLARGALKELGQSSEASSRSVNRTFFNWLPREDVSEDQLEFLSTACSYDANSTAATTFR